MGYVKERGYCGIALESPKTPENIGSVLRLSQCFHVSVLLISGDRGKRNLQHLPTDVMHSWQHLPVVELDDVTEVKPYQCEFVSIEFAEDAVDLPDFVHPERAIYIFGPEDGNVSWKSRNKSIATVKIPTEHCLNLAMAVGIVLYDRATKRKI